MNFIFYNIRNKFKRFIIQFIILKFPIFVKIFTHPAFIKKINESIIFFCVNIYFFFFVASTFLIFPFTCVLYSIPTKIHHSFLKALTLENFLFSKGIFAF